MLEEQEAGPPRPEANPAKLTGRHLVELEVRA